MIVPWSKVAKPDYGCPSQVANNEIERAAGTALVVVVCSSWRAALRFLIASDEWLEGLLV